MHYVIGDVHGCYDELMMLIDKIEDSDDDASFIFVGDFIDRGPKVWETLIWAMDNISPDGKYTAVRGNHEQMAINWYYNEFLPWWEVKKNTGISVPMPETLYDFSSLVEKRRLKKPGRLKYPIAFFESLPFDRKVEIKTKAGKNAVFRIVHAWYKYGEINEEIQQESNLWDRSLRGNYKSDEIIIHGHTPTIVPDYYKSMEKNTRPGMIGYKKNDINIDGGCCFGRISDFPCMLCAICLETLEEIYHSSITERFIKLSRRPMTKRKARMLEKEYLAAHTERPNGYRDELLEKYYTNAFEY